MPPRETLGKKVDRKALPDTVRLAGIAADMDTPTGILVLQQAMDILAGLLVLQQEGVADQSDTPAGTLVVQRAMAQSPGVPLGVGLGWMVLPDTACLAGIREDLNTLAELVVWVRLGGMALADSVCLRSIREGLNTLTELLVLVRQRTKAQSPWLRGCRLTFVAYLVLARRCEPTMSPDYLRVDV